MCQKETYLSNRVFSVSTLLNKIAEIVNDDENLGSIIEITLEMSAVTNLKAFDTPKQLKRSEVPWDKVLWTPLNEKLSKVLKIKLPKPGTRPYIGYKVKSINAMVYATYSVSDGFARVCLETHSGEEGKAIIENVLAQLPEDNPFKNAEMSQGKKNKDKWAWVVLVSMDKNDSRLVQWYADNILNAYKAAGEI